MKRVPPQVKGIARTGILRLALEKGHSVITNEVIDEAMERFMPKQPRDARPSSPRRWRSSCAKRSRSSICKQLRRRRDASPTPVRCAVCGGDRRSRRSRPR